MKKRAVITGLGAITPVGIGKNEIWDSFKNGISGTGKLTKFPMPKGFSKVAAEVKNFSPSQFIPTGFISGMDRACMFALISCQLAYENAELKIEDTNKERTGLFLSSATGGVDSAHELVSTLITKGIEGINDLNPIMYLKYPPGHWTRYISSFYDIKGPGILISSGCAAGTDSIGQAFRQIQFGLLDIAFAGGTDAPIVPLNFITFDRLRTLSRNNDEPEKACRPFDKHRDGMVMGEGGAILILEELEHAKVRKANIYAEIIGFGESFDAYHMSSPLPNGDEYARAMLMALKDANIEHTVIDYVNTHGSGTMLNDKTETEALKQCFGKHAYNLNISSTKSMTGHLFGGAGSIESIATVLAIKENVVPPTINLETPDPECDLNYTPQKSCDRTIHYAMKTSCGFSGINKVLIFKKYD